MSEHTSQIIAALKSAGLTITGQQIEADSIDIHIDHTYAGFATDYRAVSLSWRPDGRGWYLMPLDPEDESAPAAIPDDVPGVRPAEVVRYALELLEESDEWIAFVASRRAAEVAGSR